MQFKELAEEIAKEYNVTLVGRDAAKHTALVEAIESGIETAMLVEGWRPVVAGLPPDGSPLDWVFVWTLGGQMHIGYVEAGTWHLPTAAPIESTVTWWRPRFDAPPGQKWRGRK